MASTIVTPLAAPVANILKVLIEICQVSDQINPAIRLI
jgi:hypothetical protein